MAEPQNPIDAHGAHTPEWFENPLNARLAATDPIRGVEREQIMNQNPDVPHGSEPDSPVTLSRSATVRKRWMAGLAVPVAATLAAVLLLPQGAQELPLLPVAGQVGLERGIAANAVGSADAKISVWYAPELIVNENVGDLGGETDAWQLQRPTRAQLDALSAAFGVGPLVPAAVWEAGSGSDIMTEVRSRVPGSDAEAVNGWTTTNEYIPEAETLWVSPSGEWWYSNGAVGVMVSCAEPATTGDATASEPATCAPPAPAYPVPDEATLRRLAGELLTRSSGLLTGGSWKIEQVERNEWGGSVTARLSISGGRTEMLAWMGWNGSAAGPVLSNASGLIGEVKAVGRYPRLGVRDAVAQQERLWRTPMPFARDGVASSEAPVSKDLTPLDVGVVGSVPGTPGESGASGSVTGIEPEPAMQIPPVMEPTPVRIVSAVATLLPNWTESGVVLVPGYLLTGEDGSEWQVIAVAERYQQKP